MKKSNTEDLAQTWMPALPNPDIRQAAAPVSYPTAYSEEAVTKLMQEAYAAGERELGLLRIVCEQLQTRIKSADALISALEATQLQASDFDCVNAKK